MHGSSSGVDVILCVRVSQPPVREPEPRSLRATEKLARRAPPVFDEGIRCGPQGPPTGRKEETIHMKAAKVVAGSRSSYPVHWGPGLGDTFCPEVVGLHGCRAASVIQVRNLLEPACAAKSPDWAAPRVVPPPHPPQVSWEIFSL